MNRDIWDIDIIRCKNCRCWYENPTPDRYPDQPLCRNCGKHPQALTRK